jgi:pimeloyl-ACP methyl ester carboxylesterase
MRQLRREGAVLAYEEAGSGAPPIVLVHDLAADHSSFEGQFRYFSRRHRVVTVDLRGHGQSDKPSQACTVAMLADDLVWLCYELGLHRPVLVGCGLGGMVALDLAARYPDLPAGVVVAPTPSRATPPTSHRQTAVSRLESGSKGSHIVAADGSSVPEEINLLVDRFLSGLAGRAPP